MSYMKVVELIRKYEPFSPCAVGQFEACDHLGVDFEEEAMMGIPVGGILFETDAEIVSVLLGRN